MEEIDEIVGEFLVESHENLDQLDRDLVALEQEPGSRELLSSIFRTVHTIKGTSGFLAFTHLEAVTHAGENLLSRIRDGKLALNPARTSVLLELVDAIRSLLTTIEASGGEGTPDHTALVAKINVLNADEADVLLDVSDSAEPAQVVEPEVKTAAKVKKAPKVASDEVAVLSAAVAETETALPARSEEGAEVQTEQRRSIADSTLRVDVDLLDSLMRLVGELVLTRNQVVSYAGIHGDANLTRTSQRLNLIASELQEGVMKTRMQPIDNVWSKLPRVVRDLGLACGRQARLVMEGRDTELDKTILEAIKDPLTHLVRNSIDHGIEDPAERVASGKPAEGTLTLRAFHEGGQVTIEVADDGAGIDPEAIASKALERGLITKSDLARMSPREVLDLIFIAGFSTREQVSNVSGRGVGMDVVKTNIENIGGTVDIASVLGRGTTFKIKIPLTLAIIPTVAIECGGSRYALPQVSLDELVSVNGGEGQQRIEEISGAPVYRLRDKLLPLVYCRKVLGLEPSEDDGPQYIAVLRADGQKYGLVVDQVLNTEEIVVKPLSVQLKKISVYAGATILGDGRVALILDALALAQTAGVLGSDRGKIMELEETVSETIPLETLLIVRLGENGRTAIPLSAVTRLEDLPANSVENSGGRQVVQYRGQIMPLVWLSAFTGAGYVEPGERIQVVVHSNGERSVGLVVDEILDITDADISSLDEVHAPGVIGSAIVDGRITDLLDVSSAVVAADPAFYREALAIEQAQLAVGV